jgi:hypothetical protein
MDPFHEKRENSCFQRFEYNKFVFVYFSVSNEFNKFILLKLVLISALLCEYLTFLQIYVMLNFQVLNLL